MSCAGNPLLEIKEAGYLGHLRTADKKTRGVDRIRHQRHSTSQRRNEREREERKRTSTSTRSAEPARCGAGAQPQWRARLL